MNAPAKFPTIDQQAGWTDAQRAYRHAISLHCPNCSETEMKIRVDLSDLRDRAMMGTAKATDSAAVMLAEVARLATFAVYAQKTESELFRLWTALDFTIDAARLVDRVTRNG